MVVHAAQGQAWQYNLKVISGRLCHLELKSYGGRISWMGFPALIWWPYLASQPSCTNSIDVTEQSFTLWHWGSQQWRCLSWSHLAGWEVSASQLLGSNGWEVLWAGRLFNQRIVLVADLPHSIGSGKEESDLGMAWCCMALYHHISVWLKCMPTTKL